MARQKLLTKEILATLPRIYAQKDEKDPIVYVKFFTPWSHWTWYVTEGEEIEGDFKFFGLVEGDETELGYFVRSELESVKGRFGLYIERDIHWSPKRLSEVRKNA